MRNEPTDTGGSGAPASTTSVNSNGPGSAKKRLLPMELRRRRRAAKLQITSEKNVATLSAKDIIECIQESNTPDDTVTKELPPASDEQPHVQSSTPHEATTVTSISTEVDEPKTGEHTAQDEPKPSRESTTSTTSHAKRLQNLFSFSLLDRKRQKLQHRESLVEVPMTVKVDRMPVDVTLKSKAVISMSFPFPFSRPRAVSMATSMTSEPSSSPEVQWLRALQYYAHPASPLPSSLNATNERQLEESEFYVNRFQVWQESFRHAYFGFRRLSRNGTLYVRYPEFIACFYIVNPHADKEDDRTSIVGICQNFTSSRNEQNDEDKHPTRLKRLRAVISQSNARLRKELYRRGVEFHVPFNLRALQKPVTNLQVTDDDLSGHSVAASGAVHGPDSLLHFSGHQAVHGLFEFLLNRKPHSNQDVPEILSAHPFANAAIRSITVRYMGKTPVRGTNDDLSRPEPNMMTRSEVEITGVVLPSAMEKLIDCLLETQNDESPPPNGELVKAVFETAPMSERLNAVLLDDKNMATKGVVRVGAEREAWKQHLDFAKRRLLSVKTTGAREIEIDMTAR